MNNIVRFIGKDYEIPSDLEYYIEALSFFNTMRKDLVLSIVEKVRLTDIYLISDEDMLPVFNRHINKVIQMLCSRGIYNRTSEEYLNNKGYELFSESNKQACIEFTEYLKQEIDAVVSGMSSARGKAVSNITGTGIRLFSNNFLTLAGASAYEYSVLKGQANQADEQYSKEIKIVVNSAANASEKKKVNYINNTYVPNIEAAMSAFAFGIMDQYMADLIQNHKLDECILKFVDIKKSQGILNNLSLSEDKQAILENAFLTCPFNDAVYEKAAELCLCDVETLQTASKYCPNNRVVQKIIDNCTITNERSNYRNEYDRTKPFLSIITTQMGKKEPEVIRILFNEQYKYYIDTISNYNAIIELADKQMIKKFVLGIFSKDEVYSATQEQINEKLIQIVKTNILPDNFMFLCSLGFDFTDLVNDLTEQSLINYFVENMTNSIVCYIAESKIERDKINALQNEYSKTLKEKDNAISSLEQKLSSLGLFALSSKKDIKRKIETARTDRDKYKNQSPINEQLSAFQVNYID